MIRSLILVMVIGISSIVGSYAAPAEDVTTIAVMPFANITKDLQIDWLGAGFAETIATKLCMVSGIQYVERAQLAQAMKELKLQDSALIDSAAAGQLGKLIGAKFVVIGSFQKVGNQLKVNARIVDVATAVANRSADSTDTMDNVFDMQASLSRKLIESLGKTPTEEENKLVAQTPTKSLTAYEWFSKGFDFGEHGKPDDAIKAYSSAIELDGSYAQAYYNRGIAFHKKRDQDRAISDYTKAIELKSGYADAYYNRGNAHYDKGDFDRAISDYSRAIELTPDFDDAYNNRGNTFFRKNDWDKAINDYSKAIELKPDAPDAYNNRGNAFFNKGDKDRAIIDYGKAIELKPDYVSPHYNRGNAFYDKGEWDRALSDYNKAIEINSEYANAYYDKGLCCEQMGKPEEALEAYRQYLKVAPAGATRVEKARAKIEALEKT